MIRPPPRSTLFPLHDALPIFFRRKEKHGRVFENGRRTEALEAAGRGPAAAAGGVRGRRAAVRGGEGGPDRKSTRLNSSHANISYAVFCLNKNSRNATFTKAVS